MNRKITIFLVVVFIVVVIGIVWQQKRPTLTPKYIGSVEKIKIAGVLQETSTLIYLAMNKGYFIENGIDIELVETQSGVEAIDKLLRDEADIAMASESVLVNDIFINPELVTIGSLADARVVEMAARKDKGISQPSDLKGKKIGLVKKSSGEYFFRNYLSFNNLTFDQVEIIGGTPAELIADFKAGTLDAIILWSPHIFNLRKEFGEEAIFFPIQSSPFYWLAIKKKDKVKTDRDERFLKALVTAEKYAINNPQATKAIVAKKMAVSDDYFNYYWPKLNLVVSLPQNLIISMETQAHWAITNKLTEKTEVPNYLNFIYFDALEKVKPEAVNIIH